MKTKIKLKKHKKKTNTYVRNKKFYIYIKNKEFDDAKNKILGGD